MLSIRSRLLVLAAVLVVAPVVRADSATATFSGRNGHIFVTESWSDRQYATSTLNRVAPRSGRTVGSVPACSYDAYESSPSTPRAANDYCNDAGPFALSPDGRVAAALGLGYLMWPEVLGEALRLMSLDGEQEVTPIVPPVTPALARSDRWVRVRWSPDGRRLLIDRPSDTNGGHTVYVAPVAAPSRMSFVAEGSHADWSTDGRIVLVRGGNLYVGRIGALFRRLTVRGGEQPSWSPHGRWIAFVRGKRLYRIPAAGGRPRRIGRGRGHSPAWSPDGRQLAFLRTRLETAADGYVTYLHTVKLSTGRTRLIGASYPSGSDVARYGWTGQVEPPDWQALAR
jgi:hypothetical protein